MGNPLGIATGLLSGSGTVNQASNPVDWTKLKTVPAGFADGVDDGLTTAQVNALLTPPAFTAPTLLNSWANYGSGYSTAGYYKDAMGIVHLRGVVASGSSTIFTLPAGYRPEFNGMFSTVTGLLNLGRIDVMSNGNVVFVAGSNIYASLDGITFRAA